MFPLDVRGCDPVPVVHEVYSEQPLFGTMEHVHTGQ